MVLLSTTRNARRSRGSRAGRRRSIRTFVCLGCLCLSIVWIGLVGYGYLYILPTHEPSLSRSTDLVLLTERSRCRIATDVRGNLGPASVMLNNGTDWIKDRWQAASDMGGTAIKGVHWVQIDFSSRVEVRSIVLDWEAAYADRYEVQIPATGKVSDSQRLHGELLEPTSLSGKQDWTTMLQSPDPSQIQVQKYGQSPGVKTPTPLHVVHNISIDRPFTTDSMRLLILKAAMGWGVSLWRIEVLGYEVAT